MVCFDSSFLIALLRGDENAKKKAEEVEARKERKTTTIINVFELFFGAYLSTKYEKNVRLVKELIGSLEILGIDERCAEISGKISANLRKNGEKVDLGDVLIAGIVIHNGEELITSDIAHFSRIKNLRIRSF